MTLISQVKEVDRARLFGQIWRNDLNDVFADVAKYYDRANQVASLGLWNWFRRRFMGLIETHPGERALDVCAGTHAIGMALLRREPTLEVHALDRSPEMLAVGDTNARARGLTIRSRVGDAHRLPWPDGHFDIVTLQFATRHLRVEEVFSEIRRVLKPGGRFYHSDLLRPGNPLVADIYFGLLKGILHATSVLFRSAPVARRCRRYFVDALELYYSAEEFDELLKRHGFQRVAHQTLLLGTVGFHRAEKPGSVTQVSAE